MFYYVLIWFPKRHCLNWLSTLHVLLNVVTPISLTSNHVLRNCISRSMLEKWNDSRNYDKPRSLVNSINVYCYANFETLRIPIPFLHNLQTLFWFKLVYSHAKFSKNTFAQACFNRRHTFSIDFNYKLPFNSLFIFWWWHIEMSSIALYVEMSSMRRFVNPFRVNSFPAWYEIFSDFVFSPNKIILRIYEFCSHYIYI